jgi:hypothetical protein
MRSSHILGSPSRLDTHICGSDHSETSTSLTLFSPTSAIPDGGLGLPRAVRREGSDQHQIDANTTLSRVAQRAFASDALPTLRFFRLSGARAAANCAPLSGGTVVGSSVFTLGHIVTTKDVVMRIVPAGSALEAEAIVLNQDIGFVELGKPIDIRLETFPFTRHGLIEGEMKQAARPAAARPCRPVALSFRRKEAPQRRPLCISIVW